MAIWNIDDDDGEEENEDKKWYSVLDDEIDIDADEDEIFCYDCGAIVEDGFQCPICGLVVEVKAKPERK